MDEAFPPPFHKKIILTYNLINIAIVLLPNDLDIIKQRNL